MLNMVINNSLTFWNEAAFAATVFALNETMIFIHLCVNLSLPPSQYGEPDVEHKLKSNLTTLVTFTLKLLCWFLGEQF